MSLHGLTGVKIPYFKGNISLSLRKAFEEEEEQERKAVPLRKGKKGGTIKKRKERRFR